MGNTRLPTFIFLLLTAVFSTSKSLSHALLSHQTNQPFSSTQSHSKRLTLLSSPTCLGVSAHHQQSNAAGGDENGAGGVRVGIIGAGAIAFGTAAVLATSGHDPMIWSPSCVGTKDLLASDGSLHVTGALEMETKPRIASSCEQLVKENDVLIVALPANGHKKIFEQISPFVQPEQNIIISSHASLGALYLSQLLHERFSSSFQVPTITSWGTTICTARRPSGTQVRINTVRQSVDLCTIPRSASSLGLDLCQQLFPRTKFRPRDGLLAISLSNLNPQNHLGIALGNMSRMEKGETWYQSSNITPAIGRLLETLDEERLEIARALNLDVKTIFDHFSLSFHVPKTESISEMNQEIHRLGNDVHGPNTADSRYITEDVPFGLVPTIVLGKLVGRPATLHESGVHLVSAMYGRDFTAENDILQALDLENYSLEDLKEAAYTGVLSRSTTTFVKHRN